MIERIKLQNFKSLVDIDLELKSLNVLIGQNGSGKSNFLSFFGLLKAAADERLNSAISSMGGISNVIYYGAIGDKENYKCNWQVNFSDFSADDRAYHLGSLLPRATSGYTLIEEAGGEDKSGVRSYLSTQEGHVKRLQALDGPAETPYADLKDHELAIAQIRDRSRYPLLDELRQNLSDWQMYHGFGEEALRNIRGPQLFTPVDPFRLDPTGKNLLSIVQQLANERRYEKINERLIQAMKAIFPDFIKLYTPTSAGGMGSLFYGIEYFSESIPALNMSDGQLRFLGLMIILLLADLPSPPSLIAIDEPEIGMHPKMIAVFAELLQAASQKTQIIISTHSPQLIDKMKPEDVIVAEKEEGKTTLRRLDSASLGRWLERYTLGELWTMGKLKA